MIAFLLIAVWFEIDIPRRLSLHTYYTFILSSAKVPWCLLSYTLPFLEIKCTLSAGKGVDSMDSVEPGNHIQQWNPMEADFLASRNNYSYDNEDASIVIQGYSEYNIDKHLYIVWMLVYV